MKNLTIAERKARNEYFNTFRMYCENHVIDCLERLRKKLTDKNLMFKFDRNKYAIFPLDIEDRTRITDYVLSLEEAENLLICTFSSPVSCRLFSFIKKFPCIFLYSLAHIFLRNLHVLVSAQKRKKSMPLRHALQFF